MKKTSLKVAMAMVILSSMVMGNGYTASATTSKPVATQVPAEAPIMRDNLFKFGLKKEVELPVTVSAGGFNYTLEKLMFYDVKSKEAQSLMKLYGYSDQIYKAPTKYMVWTKLTIENKSSKVIQLSSNDLNPKWYLNVDGHNLLGPAPATKMLELNNKEALWDWVLKPGQKLSSYQMYGYTKDPKDISIYVNLGGELEEKYIVKAGE